VGDVIVHVEILAEDGSLIDADEHPLPALPAGEMGEDTYLLLDDDPPLPPGRYQVKLFLLAPENRQRLNIVGEDGHWIDDSLLLPQIQVRPPE
jgi:hypothetical protein